MWLLIDDMRNLNVDVIARNGVSGIRLLRNFKWTCLCIDHDLGDASEMNGYEVILTAAHENCIPNQVQIVSANPVGRQNIANVLIDNGYKTKDNINFYKD